jgi:conjugative transfer signal peptidase TraF
MMVSSIGRIRRPQHLCNGFHPIHLPGSLHSYIFLGLVTLGAGLAAARSFGLRFNLTGSLPIGLYRVTNDPPTLARGAIVLYCLPASVAGFAHERGYVPKGGRCADGLTPIGKVVVALPGDTVVVARAGITVNSQLQLHSRPLAGDRLGKRLPDLVGDSYVVRPGYIWLLAPSDRSFDSRYLGELSTANIIARIRPYWIIGTE